VSCDVVNVVGARKDTKMAGDGLITIRSVHSFVETAAALKAALKARGLTIFAEIDHAAGAAEADLPLRPTTVVIFGNPKGGTPLMQANQRTGIDLPLKLLIWEDFEGKVWLTYNDPVWIAERHGLGSVIQPIADSFSNLVRSVATESAHE
jgi:uncharacterized protein (DUF302 family)